METLFLNITITAVAYLFIPIILCLTKKQFTLSKIKKITIINGISIWLIFAIININAGGNGVSATVFLWSAVAYCLLKKKCLIHSDNTNDSNPDVLIPDNSTTTIPPLETKNILHSYCPQCNSVNYACYLSCFQYIFVHYKRRKCQIHLY